MSKHKTTKLVNAVDLKLGRFIVQGGNDYKIVELDLNPENRVIVVAVPLDTKKTAGFATRKLNELRFIVPKKTPFTVLK